MTDAELAELVPERIRKLAPYVPGKPVEELERELGITGAVKLASNENPLGPSPKGVAAAQAALLDAARYPDANGTLLRRDLAARHGCAPEEIVLGNGSNDLIDLAVRVMCEPGQDEVVTHAHSFWMIKVSGQAHGVAVHDAPVRADLSCDVDALLARVTARTKVVFLPNPNNPTGTIVSRADVEKVVDGLPARVLLVLDEAYHEYAMADVAGHPDGTTFRARRPLLLTLRTFSKAYGLAALRIGYGIGDRRLIGYLDRVRMPFNTTTAGQAAARAALGDGDFVRRSIDANRAGRTQLVDGLRQLGLTVTPGATNFVLVEIGPTALAVYDALLRQGVIVRPTKAAALPNHLRVSIGLPEENARALAAFARVLAAAPR